MIQSFKTYLDEQMKEYSSGLILTNGELILGCLVNNKKRHFYDLPKGRIDDGEEPIDACVRETKEETDLDIDKNDLEYLGVHPFLRHTTIPHKDLHLFLLKTDDLPPIENMRCTSHFIDKDGNSIPEMIGFKYFLISDINKYMLKNLANVVTKVINNKNTKQG